jgi:RHS repeat-associated protein
MKEESALGGIYDFNARYYDPAIGRFLSADTIVLKEASHFLARVIRNRSTDLRSCGTIR